MGIKAIHTLIQDLNCKTILEDSLHPLLLLPPFQHNHTFILLEVPKINVLIPGEKTASNKQAICN